MNSTTLSSLFSILCLFLIFHVPVPALCNNLYEIVCNDTKEDANNCLRLLKADSRITLAKTYLDLSKDILEMAIEKGTQAQNYFIKLTNEHPTQAIKQCANEYYYTAIESFRSSLSELVKDPQNANYDAKNAADGPANCERAMEAEGTNNPTIHSLNSEMLMISKIAFLSTNHLIHGVVESYEFMNHRKLLSS